MKNKLYTVTALTLLSISFVNAQEMGDKSKMMRQVPGGYPNGMMQKASSTMQRAEYGDMKRPKMASSSMPQTGMPAMAKMIDQMVPEMRYPMTGDSATDAQIQVLVKEMDTKIRAIHDEYNAKIKVAIGDKKVLSQGVPDLTEAREAMKQATEVVNKAQGVAGQAGQMGRQMMNQEGGKQGMMQGRRDGQGYNEGEVRGAATARPSQVEGVGGTGAQFNSMFRSMFGGGQ